MDYINNKYPEYIMGDVRQNLGLDSPEDTSQDGRINNMTKGEVLERVCNWNGLINYHSTIQGWVEDIFNIELDETSK